MLGGGSRWARVYLKQMGMGRYVSLATDGLQLAEVNTTGHYSPQDFTSTHSSLPALYNVSKVPDYS